MLIAAAGVGRRAGGSPKQFRKLGSRPLLVQTARSFDRHPRVSTISVVVPAGAEDRARAMLAGELTKLYEVAAGGKSRTESIWRGLAALPPESELVLVHDAARPFVAPTDIDAVISAGILHGAASLAIPVTDALRRLEGDRLGEAIERSTALRVQTPQAFDAHLLRRAHARARQVQYTAPDDASLVISAGSSVAFVPGSSLNMKITTKEDLLLARAFWPRWKHMQNLDG